MWNGKKKTTETVFLECFPICKMWRRYWLNIVIDMQFARQLNLDGFPRVCFTIPVLHSSVYSLLSPFSLSALDPFSLSLVQYAFHHLRLECCYFFYVLIFPCIWFLAFFFGITFSSKLTGRVYRPRDFYCLFHCLCFQLVCLYSFWHWEF